MGTVLACQSGFLSPIQKLDAAGQTSKPSTRGVETGETLELSAARVSVSLSSRVSDKILSQKKGGK